MLLLLSLCCAARTRALSLAQAAEEASQRTPAGCEGAVPLRTVLLTYTNANHFDLLLLHVRCGRDCACEALTRQRRSVALRPTRGWAAWRTAQ